MASICGTHLGHNLPDGKGDRYCIDLVCVAGQPTPANATFSSGGALALAPWRSHPVYLSLPTRTSGFNYRHRTVGGSATARVPGAPVGQSLAHQLAVPPPLGSCPGIETHSLLLHRPRVPPNPRPPTPPSRHAVRSPVCAQGRRRVERVACKRATACSTARWCWRPSGWRAGACRCTAWTRPMVPPRARCCNDQQS